MSSKFAIVTIDKLQNGYFSKRLRWTFSKRLASLVWRRKAEMGAFIQNYGLANKSSHMSGPDMPEVIKFGGVTLQRFVSCCTL